MINSSVKTWRIFLFGICCIFLSIYLKETLIYFQVINEISLLKSIILFSVIWFMIGFFRLYHLNQLYPESKTAFIKDKWCIIEYIFIFILAIGLTIIR